MTFHFLWLFHVLCISLLFLIINKKTHYNKYFFPISMNNKTTMHILCIYRVFEISYLTREFDRWILYTMLMQYIIFSIYRAAILISDGIYLELIHFSVDWLKFKFQPLDHWVFRCSLHICSMAANFIQLSELGNDDYLINRTTDRLLAGHWVQKLTVRVTRLRRHDSHVCLVCCIGKCNGFSVRDNKLALAGGTYG